jgi:MOSC domain-containing protein YiiM
MESRVLSLNISEKKGVRKKRVDTVRVKENYGIIGDAHASDKWHRQVSLLAMESIEKMKSKGLDVGPGDFAENITTQGIDIPRLKIGTHLKIGQNVELEISQIGKLCHNRCAIFEQAGDCVMPKEGIFGKIIQGGSISTGDSIEIIDSL